VKSSRFFTGAGRLLCSPSFARTLRAAKNIRWPSNKIRTRCKSVYVKKPDGRWGKLLPCLRPDFRALSVERQLRGRRVLGCSCGVAGVFVMSVGHRVRTSNHDHTTQHCEDRRTKMVGSKPLAPYREPLQPLRCEELAKCGREAGPAAGLNRCMISECM